MQGLNEPENSDRGGGVNLGCKVKILLVKKISDVIEQLAKVGSLAWRGRRQARMPNLCLFITLDRQRSRAVNIAYMLSKIPF
jgi:hypothetical protein